MLKTQTMERGEDQREEQDEMSSEGDEGMYVIFIQVTY
jgi:hypothetical protein